eukprot:snap_masked-scaffold_4-processed-gene-10.16-mRNA-1 protein AED:0.42 eAED:0.42 QI:0/-1/0/1/-1/1/1/0/144
MSLIGLLTPEHGYPILVGVASVFVTMFGGIKVAKARKKYGVEYPNCYAPPGHKNEKEFNSAQRAHQNVLENYPQFLALLAIASINRPTVAAAVGTVRLIAFVLFMTGYQSKGPQGRVAGAMLGMLSTLALVGLSAETALKVINQ